MNNDPDPLVEGFAVAIYQAAANYPEVEAVAWDAAPDDVREYYLMIGRAALAFALTRAVAIMGRVPTPEPGEGERFA